MAREKEEMGYFRVPADDEYPYDRLGHFIRHLAPEGFTEITADEAAELNEAIARQTQSAPRAPARQSVSIDLQPLQDQIDALAQTVIGHAKTLDQHDAEVKAVNLSVTEYLKGQKDIGGGEG